jgi:TfoX/Sxy family transcriptional regulator of competence genes
MGYHEKLAESVREIISGTHKRIEEKKMFGGLCFMVNDKMCVGVESARLMVRFDPLKTDEVMQMEGCTPMDFTGRVMKGYAFVSIEALGTRKKLEYWVNLALDFNEIAKPSGKNKRQRSQVK